VPHQRRHRPTERRESRRDSATVAFCSAGAPRTSLTPAPHAERGYEVNRVRRINRVNRVGDPGNAGTLLRPVRSAWRGAGVRDRRRRYGPRSVSGGITILLPRCYHFSRNPRHTSVTSAPHLRRDYARIAYGRPRWYGAGRSSSSAGPRSSSLTAYNLDGHFGIGRGARRRFCYLPTSHAVMAASFSGNSTGSNGRWQVPPRTRAARGHRPAGARGKRNRIGPIRVVEGPGAPWVSLAWRRIAHAVGRLARKLGYPF
jgi:hypothetical protein